MNQLTKVLLASMLLNHIKRIPSTKMSHNNKLKPQQLTKKLCYFQTTNNTLQSSQKGGFRTTQKDIPFQQYIKQLINKFPYCKLPRHKQRFSQDKQLQGLQYEQLVAFNSLFVVNEANRQKQLRQMAEILLKQQANLLLKNSDKQLTGAQVFTMYYQKKLPQIIGQINSGTLPEQKITLNYQVLTNLIPTNSVLKHVQQIKQQKILLMNAHIQSLHVKLLVKHNLPYIHILDKLYQQHFLATQHHKNSHVLQAAKTLLSIQSFQQLLSASITQQCINIIITNVSNMQSFDHIMVIKHIYMSKSQDCVKYINKVTQQIMLLHKMNKSEQLHVPLMLKVIKYRSKLHLENKMFLDIINSYPDKFNTVFRQKNVNKEIFLSLTTKQSTTQLNPEIRSQFGSYIRKIFQQYQQKSQIDEDELIRNLKLVLKYGNEIKREQLGVVMQIMVNSLYERIKHAVSDQLKYYVFLVAYTFNFEGILAKTTIIHETVQTYHKKCLSQPTTQNITRAINIEYQLMRKSPQSQLRKNIWVYDYTKVDLHPSVYSYLLFLLKKDKTSGSSKDKLQTINQLKKHIYRNLSHGNYSIKIIYTLIDVLDQLKYNDKYMYVDIERGLGKNLEKCLNLAGQKQKKKGVQMPLPKDIAFLKNKLVRTSLCSSKLTEFIEQSEKNYQMIHEYARDYVEKSKNWEKMKDNSKRNRTNDGNSNKRSPYTSSGNQNKVL